MKNWPLLVFDLIFLPVTVARLIIIYFTGSRYNIDGLEFLDIVQHAENKYFNQEEDNPTIDTMSEDIRTSINRSSKIFVEEPKIQQSSEPEYRPEDKIGKIKTILDIIRETNEELEELSASTQSRRRMNTNTNTNEITEDLEISEFKMNLKTDELDSNF